MSDLKLWQQLNELKANYNWVDLSHEVSPDTPHWDGFDDLKFSSVYDYDTTIFQAHKYEIVGQYGTHVDAPIHFVQGARTLETFTPKDMIMPLCVIDKSDVVQKDNDYALTVKDILDWEKENGKIPEGAFVAFMTNWSKRGNSKSMDNRDEEGNKHYPGWAVDTIEFLVKERNIGAIGHETSDTDPAVLAPVNGYAGEICILKHDRYQIELLKNLDLCPAVGAVILCTFPKVKNGAGFTARCFAICPK